MPDMTTAEWEAVVAAALRAEYPRLPATLPAEIASLVPLWAERAATLDPTVSSEGLGSYQVSYSSASQWMTALEASILRPYRRARAGTLTTDGPSSVASAELYTLGEMIDVAP